MSKKTNKVYGLIGVKALKSNWNADFTGSPKTTGDGRIYGSDKALKYAIRNFWAINGHSILMRTKYNKEDMTPKTLQMVYEDMFGPLGKKEKTEVLKNLLTVIDVETFGAAFAVPGVTLSLAGPVQIGQGYNLYEDAAVNTQTILSPFKNSKKEADQTTLGSMTFVDEAHYLYPFSVNPYNIEQEAIIAGVDGYTEESYQLFKEAARLGATALNTCTKNGCSNELAFFVEFKDGAKPFLPNLDQFVTFEKGEKDTYDFSKVMTLLEQFKDQIESIELYVDPFNVEVILGETSLSIQTLSIF